MRNVARVIAAGTTSLLLVGLAPASPAHAAATRSSEAPVAGSVVSSIPGTISATFSGETILPAPPPTLSLAGPSNQTSCSTPPTSSTGTLSCTPSKGTDASYPNGVYTVSYSFSSVPGGSTSGSFTFVLDTA